MMGLRPGRVHVSMPDAATRAVAAVPLSRDAVDDSRADRVEGTGMGISSYKFYYWGLVLSLPLVAIAVVYLLVEGDYDYAFTMAAIGLVGVAALIFVPMLRRRRQGR